MRSSLRLSTSLSVKLSACSRLSSCKSSSLSSSSSCDLARSSPDLASAVARRCSKPSWSTSGSLARLRGAAPSVAMIRLRLSGPSVSAAPGVSYRSKRDWLGGCSSGALLPAKGAVGWARSKAEPSAGSLMSPCDLGPLVSGIRALLSSPGLP